jgi:hypothetical protein
MADNCGAKFGQLAILQSLDPRACSSRCHGVLRASAGASDCVAAEWICAGEQDTIAADATVRVAVVGATEVALTALSPLPPQASVSSESAATGAVGSSGRPIDELLKTWIRQSIGASVLSSEISLSLSYDFVAPPPQWADALSVAISSRSRTMGSGRRSEWRTSCPT